VRLLKSLPILLLATGLGLVAVPAPAGAEPPAYAPVLAFAGDTARVVAGQVAVPVECLGEASGFCSGTVTLSRAGKRAVTQFALRGGARESLFVPLPLGTSHPTKVSATLSTAGRGEATNTKSLLFIR